MFEVAVRRAPPDDEGEHKNLLHSPLECSVERVYCNLVASCSEKCLENISRFGLIFFSENTSQGRLSRIISSTGVFLLVGLAFHQRRPRSVQPGLHRYHLHFCSIDCRFSLYPPSTCFVDRTYGPYIVQGVEHSYVTAVFRSRCEIVSGKFMLRRPVVSFWNMPRLFSPPGQEFSAVSRGMNPYLTAIDAWNSQEEYCAES